MISPQVKRIANEAGELPAAITGGYPIYYVGVEGDVMCPDCANEDEGPQAYFVHYEGRPVYCQHCGAAVESAYGEVD